MSNCSREKLIVGKYRVILNGYDLGTTDGAVSISQENEYTEIYNQQTDTLQAIFRTRQDFMVTVTMRDLTLDKLRFIYGVPGGDPGNGVGLDTDVLCIGSDGLCSFPDEYSLTIMGPGPGCGCRTFHFPRVVVTPGTVAYDISREEAVSVEVEFRVLASCPDGIIGCITDICDTISTDIDTQATINPNIDDPFPNTTTTAA